LTALHQVDQSITRLRERNGMPGIDDPLPHQPTTYSDASDTFCSAPRRPERIPVQIRSNRETVHRWSMGSNVTVRQPRALDEFADWTDEVENHDEQMISERAIIGQLVRFGND
jgi:hypothetical protein